MPWLFGDYALDQERRQLLRAKTPLALEPKAYELLSLLLTCRPRALSKAQIRDVLWPGTFVSESALAGLVTDLRALLADDPRRPRFIRTVHGFGYAFCGEAREDGQRPTTAAAPSLRILVLSSSGSPQSFDRPLAALTAALDEPAGAAVHAVEFTPGSRPPSLLRQLACLAQRRQVLLSRAAFDLAREAADGNGDGLAWLAHGPYLFEGLTEPVDVFEVGRPGQSVLRPPPDTEHARRAVRPGDEATLGWRPAPGLSVPGREGWTFLDKLGEGGFGEVWLAGHASGERRVFKFCFDASHLRGLKREATLFRILKDELGDREDIAKVLDWNFDQAPYFLESEYTEGGSLTDWARAAGGMATIDLGTRVELIAQVAEALAAAHSVGVLHKDVKPQNVLVTEDAEGRPKARLTDFGVGLVRDKSVLLGRDFTVTGFSEAPDDANRSGTRLYAAPEVLEGRTPTTLADIYALGVMLYQVVVGDLERALAPGWERDVADDLLREDIGLCVEGRPERRLANALVLAERLRGLKERRAERAAPRRRRQQRRAWAAVGTLALLGLGVMLFRLGERAAERPVHSFHRLTFRRGANNGARFAPDGQTIIYSANWDGQPIRLFTTRLGRPESRPMDLPDADLLAISSLGEMAISLNRPVGDPGGTYGTLARVPIDGGAPREVLDNVQSADWSPDGKDLAVVHQVGERRRLEYPIGKVLYEAEPNLINDVRVSPTGDLVAFEGDPGVGVIDRSGTRRVLYPDGHTPTWSPKGDEIWFTMPSEARTDVSLHAVTLSGRARLLAPFTGFAQLRDISRDGRALMAVADLRAGVLGLAPGSRQERELSWLGLSNVSDLSGDGTMLLFSDGGQAGLGSVATFLRKTDGSVPPVRLADGLAQALSPDAKLALVHNGPTSELLVVPTGAGETTVLKSGGIEYAAQGFDLGTAAFFPDRKRILVAGRQPGHPGRWYVQSLEGGPPQPFLPEGLSDAIISPDGQLVAAVRDVDKKLLLYPAHGGEPRAVPGLAEKGWLRRWSADGRSLFLVEIEGRVIRVLRRDLASGRRELLKEITPADPAGVFGLRPVIAADGKSYAYNYWRYLSNLYLVEGLR